MLQTRQLLKFQSPPTPPSAVGTAGHKGRGSDEMWGNHVAWRVRAGGPPLGTALHAQKGGDK